MQKSPGKRWRRIGFFVAALTFLSLAVGCVVLSALSDPRPTGAAGEEADGLAREVQAAVSIEGWARTRAVRFRAGDRRPVHLWDRDRGFVLVDHGDRQVLLRTSDRSGVIVRDGEVSAASEDDLRGAWAGFINDSFWTYPFATFFDDGVTRSVVEVEEGRGLLIEYGTGGVTPGDAYLWIVDNDGAPSAWRMWASVLLVGGIHVTWSEWREQPTGVRFPLKRSGLGLDVTYQAEGAASLAALVPGPDPFLPLLGELTPTPQPSSMPASQPPSSQPSSMPASQPSSQL